MADKNRRRISMLVTAQTDYNLKKLAYMSGLKNPGRVVDKLVREKMLSLRTNSFGTEQNKCDK